MGLRSFIREWLSRPLVRDIFSTTALALAGRSTGFLIPFFIAAWFGAGRETDVFFFVYGLVLLATTVFGDAVGEVLIPFLTEIREKGEGVSIYVGRLMVLGGGLVALVVLLLYLVARVSLPLVLKFSPGQMALLFRLLLEMAPLVVLVSWVNVLMAALNSAKRFSLPAISLSFRSVVTLLTMYLFKDRLGVHSIVLGYVAGEGVRLVVMLSRVAALEGFPISRDSFHWDPSLLRFLSVAFFRSGAMILNHVNQTVDKAMASWLVVGSVSVLHYAGRLTMIPILFLTSGTMIPFVSHWSERFTREGLSRLKRDVRKAAIVMALAASVVALLLALFSGPLVKLALGHGMMKEAPLHLVQWAWVCYLLGLPFRLVSRVLLRIYIVLQRTRIVLFQAVAGAVLNGLFNWVLMQKLGVVGIALSTSAVALLSMFFWLWAYRVAKE